MTLATSPAPEEASPLALSRSKRRWRPGVLTVISTVLALIGLSVVIYPSGSSWVSSYSQSQIIRGFSHEDDGGSLVIAEELEAARDYNDALSTGVRLDANTNVPPGSGVLSNNSLIYKDILAIGTSDVMARIRIPSIDVDLPIYHGTSDEVLLKGVGHLEGSHLPVGGIDTHAVLTAHRGLAQATMFSNLDKVKVSDRFTIQVLAEVLTYEVKETKVVEPEDTDTLLAVAGKDRIALVTCTPLGINSHRILVTAERVTPTPIADIEEAGADPTIPGFPWWAVGYGAGLLIIGAYFWKAGYLDGRRANAKRARAGFDDPSA